MLSLKVPGEMLKTFLHSGAFAIPVSFVDCGDAGCGEVFKEGG